MRADCFLDTNVLVYAATGIGEEEPKRARALELIEQTSFGLSTQVLQEFYVTVVRKARVPLRAEEALEWIEQFEAFPIQLIDLAVVKIGIELSERFRVSYWDGAILAAADALGAQTLYSEDLSHGQRYDTLQVVNPFLDV